jgi:hypothetical protein
MVFSVFRLTPNVPLRRRDAWVLGLLLGAAFGLWNLINTGLDPLAEDTAGALLTFYGPMFAIWGCTGFAAARRTGRLSTAVEIGATVAFATFVVFDLSAIVRVNLFLDSISQRSDWQNLMAQFQTSGFDSLRQYANYAYMTGAPFKILIASLVGAGCGFVGGCIGALGREMPPPR